jgi:hypothetical protein
MRMNYSPGASGRDSPSIFSAIVLQREEEEEGKRSTGIGTKKPREYSLTCPLFIYPSECGIFQDFLLNNCLWIMEQNIVFPVLIGN